MEDNIKAIKVMENNIAAIKANPMLIDAVKRYDIEGVTLSEITEFKSIVDKECFLSIPQLLNVWHGYHVLFTSLKSN